MQSRRWNAGWQLLTWSALIGLLLTVVGRLPSVSARNGFNVTAVSGIQDHTVSPYICELMDGCSDAALFLREIDGQFFLVSETKVAAEPIEADFQLLTVGAAAYRAGNDAAAAVVWRENPLIADYLFHIVNEYGPSMADQKRLLALSLAVNPTAEAYFAWGDILFAENKFKEAAKAYQQGIERTLPDNERLLARMLLKLGRAHLQLGMLQAAQENFIRARELDNSESAILGLGQTLLRKNQFVDALLVIQQGRAAYPHNKSLMYNEALVNMQLGQLDAAHAQISLLLTLEPADAESWRLLARIERQRGNRAEATAAWQQYEQLEQEGSDRDEE